MIDIDLFELWHYYYSVCFNSLFNTSYRVPESCSSRFGTEKNCIVRPTSSEESKISITDGSIFLAADLENEEVLQQHAVNIERFPNRCWRGANSSRTQYEKGYSVN